MTEFPEHADKQDSDHTPLVDPINHAFDQTNGLADVDGDSDGTAESDTSSASERALENEEGGPVFLPPMSGGMPERP